MQHNPHKRVTRISVEKDQDDFRVLLETNDAGALRVETRGLTARQVGVLGDGYVNGLEWGQVLPRETIEMLVNDPLEMASLQVPLKIEPVDRALFRRGTTSALKLVANGYWLSARDPGTEPAPVSEASLSLVPC